MTTFAIATLGCKVNTYESQGYESALLEKGYQQVSFKDKADIYIINTCAVTNTAGAKSRQKINQAHALNPEAIIAVVGCYVQTAGESMKDLEHIDILIGSDEKATLADRIEYAKDHRHEKQVVLHDVRALKVFEALPIQKFEHQTRAFLKIQDGCNQFCSYCIIPYARGAERSLKEDEAIKVASDLVKNGHLEIVLSGIHTGRYGRDLNTTLLHLMKRMVHEVEGLQRIRISSIEMNEINDELLLFMKEEKKIARHLHIPIQSANTTVLKKMNRPYDVAWFKERVDYIRSLMPDISISTDVITGFPQESEEEFEDTMNNIKEINFSFLHVFPFSKRDHTVAASMSGHLDNKVKKHRAAMLGDISNQLYASYKKGFVNKQVEVLLEKLEDGYLFGHTSEYLPVYVKADIQELHTMKTVTITSFENDRLYAN
ncbi:tRNA (N(6)-L-threonylcarbamoyladenosine(37)-C(2))-methylthiotransferase MtaB [[Eubacterium] hominis]|uniref:tRNA (N(6)-L-threonylcarbamoyladenosine(37)-C(2))- methylthiotransferase MtaB n=1 Tax=[Eubacterium] hominis TaxID=2764325 RepID=UPI003A4D8AF3